MRGMQADRGRRYSEIENEAAAVRRIVLPELGLLNQIPGIQLFEGLCGFSVNCGKGQFTIDPDVRELPKDTEAETRYEHSQLRVILSERTYSQLENYDPRARFTLCHEIGHACLHTSLLYQLGTLPVANVALARARPHQIYENTEWQADSFAGALLMPAKALAQLETEYGELTIGLVARVFGTSTQAASVRIRKFQDRRNELLW